MKKIILLSSFMILLSFVSAFADTINVPGDQPTIQSGIDAASDGDEVVLANGTYSGAGNYNVDFKGKSITLRSSGGAENCIVDCEGLSRGFLVYNGETVTFAGLSVQNGNAGDGNDGGAIYANGSEIEVNDCLFSGNSASGAGGAVYSSYSSSFSNCTFTDNSASSGGAVSSSSSATSFANCTFISNVALNGIYGSGAVNSSGATFENCTFRDNRSEGSSFFGNASGGAVYSAGGFSSFTNCTFTGNSTSGAGGAVYSSYYSSSFTNCAFTGNSASGAGGAVYSSYSSSSFSNCTFTLNEASEQGGAIWCNITLSPEDPITLKNCILWGNTAPEGAEIYEKEKPLIITYSDIQGGHAGEGNIDSDPLFIDAANNDLHLQYSSPCVDTGTADGAPADDLDGNPRPAGSGFDMGAYEVQSSITISTLTAIPDNGAPPLTVYFTCTASDSISTITAYDWVFGDGNTQTTSSGTTQHTYNSSGSFTASCTVRNSAGEQSSKTVTVAVNNDNPIADAGPDQIVPGNSVELDGSGSYDPDGTIASWQWTLEHLDNSAYDKTATGETPNVSSLEHGNYSVTLTVIDNHGATKTDEMYLSVAAAPTYQDGYYRGYLEGMDEGLNNSGNTIAGIIEEGANGEKVIEGPVIIKGVLVVE